ncbi:titin-like [Oncorhynchus nerka]|uniref:titin-like n=1 Tax=Oncorhynchus nerka TaxID=8023 RepID=UPI0031B88631
MVEAVRGTVALFQCEVAGTAPFEFNWFRSKKSLASDRKYKIVSQDSIASLEICSFESADVGEYQCVVSNDVGSITAKTIAKQKEPPSFAKKIENTTAVLGSAVKLQGTIKGSAPITVKWMKDAEWLRDDDPNITMAFQNNIAILTIAAVDICHGGKYTCQAENEAGQQKCETSLAVQEPARILEKAASINVTSGESATLECTIAGSPDLKVKWLQDGKEITGGRKYKITLKDNVAILKIVAAEKGGTCEYTMEVSNRVGKDQCSCSVTVLDRVLPPSFTKNLKKVDGNIGNNITMESKVSGSQPMSISWYKDDKEITSGQKYQLEMKETTATLGITQIEKCDEGVYTCRATNSAGFKESSGTLCVKEPPIFTLKPDNQDVVPGSTVVLKSAFTGSAPFTIKWFREDKEITTRGASFIKKDASSSFLELHSVKPSDSANYTCQVANDAGKVAHSAVLFVKGAFSLINYVYFFVQLFLMLLSFEVIVIINYFQNLLSFQ